MATGDLAQEQPGLRDSPGCSQGPGLPRKPDWVEGEGDRQAIMTSASVVP